MEHLVLGVKVALGPAVQRCLCARLMPYTGDIAQDPCLPTPDILLGEAGIKITAMEKLEG